MEISAANIEEMSEALREIHDRRRQSGNFRHRLIDILVIRAEGLQTLSAIPLKSNGPQGPLIALAAMIVGEDEYEAMGGLRSGAGGILPDISGIAERDTGGMDV